MSEYEFNKPIWSDAAVAEHIGKAGCHKDTLIRWSKKVKDGNGRQIVKRGRGGRWNANRVKAALKREAALL